MATRRKPADRECPVCQRRYAPGHPFVSHMRMHVRAGEAMERREEYYWYVGSRRHEGSELVFKALPRCEGRTLEVTMPEGMSVVCPNCGGSGNDPDTMICVMCGGDGKLEG